jgi:hypothetical protein
MAPSQSKAAALAAKAAQMNNAAASSSSSTSTSSSLTNAISHTQAKDEQRQHLQQLASLNKQGAVNPVLQAILDSPEIKPDWDAAHAGGRLQVCLSFLSLLFPSPTDMLPPPRRRMRFRRSC